MRGGSGHLASRYDRRRALAAGVRQLTERPPGPHPAGPAAGARGPVPSSNGRPRSRAILAPQFVATGRALLLHQLWLLPRDASVARGWIGAGAPAADTAECSLPQSQPLDRQPLWLRESLPALAQEAPATTPARQTPGARRAAFVCTSAPPRRAALQRGRDRQVADRRKRARGGTG